VAELDLPFESPEPDSDFGLPELLGLLAEEAERLAAARLLEKSSLSEFLELDDFVVPLEEELAEEGRTSSATCHHSICPRARGALVRLVLFAPVEGVCFLSLEALHHLTDGFGALGGALPVLFLAVALRANASHNLCLLSDGLFEAAEECLVIARQHAIDAGFGADRKAADIARVVALELGELCLAFAHPPLGAGECLGAPPLLVFHDVLHHFQSLRALHGLYLSGGSGSVRFSATTVRQYRSQGCEACREIDTLVDILS
jgi:hypothetical protein